MQITKKVRKLLEGMSNEDLHTILHPHLGQANYRCSYCGFPFSDPTGNAFLLQKAKSAYILIFRLFCSTRCGGPCTGGASSSQLLCPTLTKGARGVSEPPGWGWAARGLSLQESNSRCTPGKPYQYWYKFF